MPIQFTHVAGAERRSDTASLVPFFHDIVDASRKFSAVEAAGFRRFVIDDQAGLLTNMDLADQAIEHTAAVEIVLTHWAGVVEPTVAARQLAMLDVKSGGRLSLRMSGEALGADDTSGARWAHAALWQRMDEYLVLLKRLWSNEVPFDHEGAFYSVRGGYVPRKSLRGAAIPIRVGGLSGTALKVAGRHADIFEVTPGSPDEVRHLIERVRTAAAEYGRSDRIRFALPVRIEDQRDVQSHASRTLPVPATPARIAAVLLPYTALGITEFMVSGVNSAEAIESFGRQTAPVLRAALARGGVAESVATPGSIAHGTFRHYAG